MNPKQLLLRLGESYIFILLFSIVAGIIFSKQAIYLAPLSTVFLAIIFFLSALKIDLNEIRQYLKYGQTIFAVNLLMLIILPITAYYITLLIIPELAIAFLILAAMPCGMTAPLLSEICGGKESLALVLTVSTSLLAPLTIPFIIKITAGTTIDVNFLSMFVALAKVIFIPFILANIVKYSWHHKVKATYWTFKPFSITLLGLLIIGIVAKQADNILNALEGRFIFYLIMLFIFFGILHLVGYYAIFWKHKKDRLTITICLTYMNFTLAIYLVGKFFEQPNIVMPVILSVLPWSLIIIPFKYIIRRINIK